MKKLMLLLLFIPLINCGSVSPNINLAPVSDVTNQVSEGIHVDEFLKIAGDRAQKDEIFARSYYIYRVDQKSSSGYIIDTRFFQFLSSNDLLISVSQGESTKKLEQ